MLACRYYRYCCCIYEWFNESTKCKFTYYAPNGFPRNLRTDIDGLEELSHYWSVVRPYYADFESDIKSPNTEIYQHEMPGGQYSNLSQQAKSLDWANVLMKSKRCIVVSTSCLEIL